MIRQSISQITTKKPYLDQSIEDNPQVQQQRRLPKIRTSFKLKNKIPNFKGLQLSKSKIKKRNSISVETNQFGGKSPLRTKRQIQKNIQSSITYINAIRQKRGRIKLNNTRFLTQPTIEISQPRLFSYLQRDIFLKKQHQLTNEDVHKFYNTPSNKGIQQNVRMKSRKFLKNAMTNDFHNYVKANDLYYQDSKIAIRKQIKQKKQKYAQQYKFRRNCPYFSYLTLSKSERQSIIANIHK